jgi:hypothetical protein
MLAGLAVVVAVGAAVVVLLPARDDAPVEKIERVSKGMTRADVEAILGSPDPVLMLNRLPTRSGGFSIQKVHLVHFDDQGRVAFSSESSREQRNTRGDEFLRRVRRLWHRWFP